MYSNGPIKRAGKVCGDSQDLKSSGNYTGDLRCICICFNVVSFMETGKRKDNNREFITQNNKDFQEKVCVFITVYLGLTVIVCSGEFQSYRVDSITLAGHV